MRHFRVGSKATQLAVLLLSLTLIHCGTGLVNGKGGGGGGGGGGPVGFQNAGSFAAGQFVQSNFTATTFPSSYSFEAYIKPQPPTNFATDCTGNGCIISAAKSNTGVAFAFLAIMSSGKLGFWLPTSGTCPTTISPGVTTSVGTLVSGTKYHVVGQYDGANLQIFINGVLDTNTPLGTVACNGSFGALTASTSGNTFFGVLDELRISNGARYPGAFTPSTVPFTGDANTLMLQHFDSTLTNVDYTTFSYTGPTTTAPTSVTSPFP